MFNYAWCIVDAVFFIYFIVFCLLCGIPTANVLDKILTLLGTYDFEVSIITLTTTK